jgi:hypothetical protein
MEPRIDSTEFGEIVVDGQKLDYDIVIGLEGKVRKRKKKLSKQQYGTSHIVSLDEIKDIYQDGAEWLLIGTGQEDQVRLSDEARAYLDKRHCKPRLLDTPGAARAWNKADGKGLGLFHITC